MCAYNKVNGMYASQNRWLLTDVLRDEWGFDGLVVSDWGAVNDRVAALAAGLDLEMPPNLGMSDAAIVAAVRDGELDEAVLDTAVTRVLQLVDRAGAAGEPAADLDVDAHHAFARAAAADCAVLLKNDGGLLPLRPSAGETVAVIGEFARTPRYQGAGSSQVNSTRVDVPLDELRAAVPDGIEVAFAAGFGIGPTENDEQLAAEAVELAGRAGTVVAFLGLPAADESEGYDRDHMDLPPNQTALVPRLAAANPNLVVVLANGSAVRVADWERCAPSILECWLSGQAAGGAVADLLLGAANPSGRLAETLPLRLEDNPSALNFPGEEGHVRYGEGVFVGYRGYDALRQQVSYPFGHGLSYTRFDYTDLSVTVSGRPEDGDLAVEVTCRITNAGDRAGKEVVQLYVGDPEASVARPVRELKAFAKVDLAPGESSAVTFRLAARDLSYWSSRTAPMGPGGRRVRARRRCLVPRPAAHHHGGRRSAAAPGPARRQRRSRGVARRPRRPRTPTQGGWHRRDRQAERHRRRRGTAPQDRQLPAQPPRRLLRHGHYPRHRPGTHRCCRCTNRRLSVRLEIGWRPT